MCDYCSWIKRAFEKANIKTENFEEANCGITVEPIIIVHGGAGNIPKFAREFMLQEVKNAARDTYEKLMNGTNAIDAVVLAINHMESRKYFNCAKGGSVDINGDVVMDAAVMNNNFEAGCVGSIRDIEHPIDLARAVLEKTDHVLLVENGAQRFAVSIGIPILSSGSLLLCEAPPPSINSQEIDDFQNEDEFKEFDNYIPKIVQHLVEKSMEIPQEKLAECVTRRLSNKNEEQKEFEIEEPMDLSLSAVGAVAFDQEGKFVCGTSTAGNRGKLIGSISSIGTVIGCGIFANRFGCASVSGEDTAIYTYAPARKIVEKLKMMEINILDHDERSVCN
ncbi:isoaspartyl peptidase/L-asparaginase-like isoform X2 [Leptopilina heterotoma]|uniref:isoaspartyl peptidase/L-asparaginase-like isoform X2 n=1 Tax=Leptopilina heterotoma TaxID=63436 RepID=UPI001CAA1157|nr:isoaspartyl peptidase/L-asparaginase-like isoform X2 [Leptopilina heterotoma]